MTDAELALHELRQQLDLDKGSMRLRNAIEHLERQVERERRASSELDGIIGAMGDDGPVHD